MEYKSLIDLHTHTVASGHAYSTLQEMVSAAKEKELKVLGITEHGPRMYGSCTEIYFQNLAIIPRKYGDLRLMMGAEMNIMDERGSVDLTDGLISLLDVRIAGIHSRCFNYGSEDVATKAICKTMERGDIDIISHPVDRRHHPDVKTLVEVSKATGTLLELNNSSLRPERGKPYARANFKELIEECAKENVQIIIGSDAHISYDVAGHSYAYSLVEEVGFPKELILNLRPDDFISFIDSRREAQG